MLVWDCFAVCVTITVGSCGDGQSTSKGTPPSSGSTCQNGSKTVTLPQRYYSCPELVNSTNWLVNNPSLSDTERNLQFSTAFEYGHADVTLTTTSTNLSGWNMTLQFKCCLWAGNRIPVYGNWYENGRYFNLLGPANDGIVRIDEPYLSTTNNRGYSPEEMSLVYSGGDDSPTLTEWARDHFDELVGNCTMTTPPPNGDPWTWSLSWTWSFWARVDHFGSASGLVVMAKTYQDPIANKNHSSWRIMLYQNGNIGLEAMDLDAEVREAAPFALRSPCSSAHAPLDIP